MTSWTTMTTDRLTRIVIYAHRPKRVRKRKAQAAAIAGPRIVASKQPKPGRPWRRPESDSDPVAEARDG